MKMFSGGATSPRLLRSQAEISPQPRQPLGLPSYRTAPAAASSAALARLASTEKRKQAQVRLPVRNRLSSRRGVLALGSGKGCRLNAQPVRHRWRALAAQANTLRIELS
jgi:hypothetical protein